MRRSGYGALLLGIAIVTGTAASAAAQHHGGHGVHGVWWWGNYNGGGYPYVVSGAFPPVVVPAGAIFGPGVGMIDPNAGVMANPPPPRGVNGAAANGAGVMNGQAGGGNQAPADPLPADMQVHGKPRTTNAAAKVRAGKFLQFGDASFAKQKYNSALERYREATTAAPDLADCYFRQCFALIALGQYESAARTLERGLRIRPNWPDSRFELTTIYGPDSQLAQAVHREALATAIEQNPQDADPLVLLGLLMHCSGERERSQLYFDQAVELGANAERLLDKFIAPHPVEAPAPAKPAKA